MTLESSLGDVADPTRKLGSKQLVGLTDLSPADLTLFAATWAGLAPSRRLGLLTGLTDLAQDNVELNFDAVFKLALDDEEGEVRVAAVRGLYEYQGTDLIPILIAFLRDDADAGVRMEGAIALGRYALASELDRLSVEDAGAVRQALTDAVRDGDQDDMVRAKAIEALGALSDEEAQNLIESTYREDSLWLKVGAVDAMGRSADEGWLPVVIREMTNRAPQMRHAAAFAAGEIGSEEAISHLVDVAAEDPDREVQLAAVHALGEIGGRHAKVALQGLLYRGDDDLREAIEEAMAQAALADDPITGLGL